MSEAPTAQDELLTTKEAAGLLKITRRHLYTLISEGHITTVRMPTASGGREHRIERSEIQAFVRRNRQSASQT
jgi:excisionase family DNA binding protein